MPLRGFSLPFLLLTLHPRPKLLPEPRRYAARETLWYCTPTNFFSFFLYPCEPVGGVTEQLSLHAGRQREHMRVHRARAHYAGLM